MRYPQMFAAKAIVEKLNSGVKKGIIWHTQGSGKTALTYYSVKYLTDYFQAKGVIPKFYFIVDRIDLLIQAGREFKSRGLVVHNINSREEFARDIKATSVIHNNSGKAEITVVNIQKFQDDTDVLKNNDYNLNIPRYVDTFEEEDAIDLKAITTELRELAVLGKTTDATIEGFCKELGIETPF
jgi:type I restriction enzyme R subunit